MKQSVIVAACLAMLSLAIIAAPAAGQIDRVKQGVGFTCLVHRDVKQPMPGKCPTCGLDLMPAGKVDQGGLKAGETFKMAGGTATVKELTTLPLVKNWCSERFKFDCHGDASLEKLRAQEKLDEVTAKGKTEFEKQVLLLNWAHKRFKLFGSPTKKGVEGKPLAILAAIDEGNAFNCMYYATVLRSALQSCGYVVREIGLKGAKSDGNGTDHGVVEVWSNQHRRWVMLDPTLDVYFTKGGLPLNAFEVRQDWFYNEGKDLGIVVGTEPKVYTKADLPIARGTHKGFGTLMLKGESIAKLLFISYTPINADGSPDYGQMFITKDKLCEGIQYHTRRNPEKPAEEPYYPVQQASVLVLPWDATQVKVWTLTLTPDFKTFRYRLDGKAWADGGANLMWTLHKGENTLEAVSTNKFGVEGAASKIVIDVQP